MATAAVEADSRRLVRFKAVLWFQDGRSHENCVEYKCLAIWSGRPEEEVVRFWSWRRRGEATDYQRP